MSTYPQLIYTDEIFVKNKIFSVFCVIYYYIFI